MFYYGTYSVVAHVARVLDHAADHLRREQRQLRDKRRGDGVEVGALVFFDAARGADLPDVKPVLLWSAGGAQGTGDPAT